MSAWCSKDQVTSDDIYVFKAALGNRVSEKVKNSKLWHLLLARLISLVLFWLSCAPAKLKCEKTANGSLAWRGKNRECAEKRRWCRIWQAVSSMFHWSKCENWGNVERRCWEKQVRCRLSSWCVWRVAAYVSDSKASLVRTLMPRFQSFTAIICILVFRCGSAHVMLWNKSNQASHRLSLSSQTCWQSLKYTTLMYMNWPFIRECTVERWEENKGHKGEGGTFLIIRSIVAELIVVVCRLNDCLVWD